MLYISFTLLAFSVLVIILYIQSLRKIDSLYEEIDTIRVSRDSYYNENNKLLTRVADLTADITRTLKGSEDLKASHSALLTQLNDSLSAYERQSRLLEQSTATIEEQNATIKKQSARLKELEQFQVELRSADTTTPIANVSQQDDVPTTPTAPKKRSHHKKKQ